MKVKVFTDDLEDALRNMHAQPFSLPDEKACMAQKTYLEKYFATHLKIKINKKELSYQLTGCEKFDDAVWLSFEGSSPQSWKEISITADFLVELFPTQTNVINLSVNGKKRFLRLTHKQPTGQLIFD
ncbi:MAG: hypothetical protein HC811_09120 [Flammeovirgaceae bacterium]|nr:hypothetical protein [Flammeovirgaceae bacterium]